MAKLLIIDKDGELMSMTNYPAEFAPDCREFSLSKLAAIFKIAIGMATWNPRQWAKNHKTAIDLPSAYWMACHAVEELESLEKENCCFCRKPLDQINAGLDDRYCQECWEAIADQEWWKVLGNAEK